MSYLENNEKLEDTYSEGEEEKRQSIVQDINKNIFVEAGAGAGKTSLIVSRVVNQIKQGIRPEELVVITFTNKAAEELFERIADALVREEQNADADSVEKANCTYAIEHIEQMNISTIHSFCFKLLQQRCFEGALPLDISVLENEEAQDRKYSFFEKWYSKLSTADVWNMRTILQEIGYWDIREFLKMMFEEICEKSADVNIVCLEQNELLQLKQKLDLKKQEAEQYKQQMIKELTNLTDYLVKIIDGGSKQWTVDKVLNTPKKYIIQGYKDVLKSAIAGFPTGISSKVKSIYTDASIQICLKNVPELEIACKYWLTTNLYKNPGCSTYELWKKTKIEAEEYGKAYVYFAMMEYAVKAKEEYRKLLNGQELSNDELLQRAESLIKKSEEARKYFCEKYKCIYVDEFQDTDHIQANIIWNLALDEKGKTLRKGALFVVGDPKQAIYRFRGGEPAVYYDVKDRMKRISEVSPEETEVYELDNNFRSSRGVISWVNEQFKEAFKESEVKYRNMECKIPEDALKETKEEWTVLEGVYRINKESEERNADAKVADEAEVIADFINHVIEGNYGIYETHRQADGSILRKLRKVEYKDFLVLCRGKTDMEKYLPIWERKHIPVELSGEIDMSDNSVLKNFIKLFQYLLCPDDRKAYQGAVHVISRENSIENREIARGRLEKLRNNTKGMSSRAVVRYLTEHPEYLIPWDKDISKAELKSFQSKLFMMTEKVLSITKEDPTLMGKAFLNYLETKQDRELALNEDVNAVRFMNIHKVKGLEGNIVLLMNRKSMPAHFASCQIRKADDTYDYYGAFSKRTTGFKSYEAHPYGDDKLKEIGIQSVKEEMEEFTRLEYVAATRAREVLVVFKELAKDNAFFGQYKIEASRALDDILKKEETASDTAESDTESISFKEVLEKRKSSVPEEEEMNIQKKSYVNLSPSMLEGNSNREEETVWEKESVQNRARRPKGNIFGTVMHRSFELLIRGGGKEIFSFSEEKRMRNIHKCICQAIMENYEELLGEGTRLYLMEEEATEVYIDAVKEYLTKVLTGFVKSRKIQEIIEHADEIYTELPFSYYTSLEQDAELFEAIKNHLTNHKITVEPGQPVWINGTADLVVKGNDGSIKIIDFKSDTKTLKDMEAFEHTLNRRYEGQMLLYRYSMSKLFHIPLEDVSVELYHLYGTI